MAAITPRSYADGRKVYRVRIRRHGILVCRQFPTRSEAEAFAKATEGDLESRAPAEACTLAVLIDKCRPTAPNELRFRRFGENSFVRATVEPVAGRTGIVNLRLSWQRSLTLVGDDAIRIAVAPDNSNEIVSPEGIVSRS